MTTLHAIVPAAIHDPERPSGGNVYDARLLTALTALDSHDWSVVEHAVGGGWPEPDDLSRSDLAAAVATVPDGGVALVDGLLASDSPAVLAPLAERARLVVLVHLPRESLREAAVLGAADAVIATSTWTRERLLAAYDLDPRRVHVAKPGVDPAPLVHGSPGGRRLLTVAAVTPGKGHDVLVEALAQLGSDLDWQCTCVGPLTSDPAHAAHVLDLAERSGVSDRLSFVGPLSPPALRSRYAAHDLLVHPSLFETYGMVVTEALAHGLPVVATDVGGLPDALGAGGTLVPAGDSDALAAALHGWLTDPAGRERMRAAAARRRDELPTWADTAAKVAATLTPSPIERAIRDTHPQPNRKSNP